MGAKTKTAPSEVLLQNPVDYRNGHMSISILRFQKFFRLAYGTFLTKDIVSGHVNLVYQTL